MTTSAARIGQLRERPEQDRRTVNAEAWQVLRGLRDRAGDDPEGISVQLATLFASGTSSAGIDGVTEGMLVTPLIQRQTDRALRAVARRWMPWLGKRFDAERGTGDNRLAPSARVPAKVLWPGYRMTRTPDGSLAAFRFETRTEPGALGDGVEVLAIDYAAVRDNPDLVIRRVRDELVRLAGDVHLGRILYRRGGGFELIGYFALRAA